jgi:hypothetical protein
MRLDQQHLDLVAFIERSVSIILNQVPQIELGVFLSMGGFLNVILLQQPLSLPQCSLKTCQRIREVEPLPKLNPHL